jgi:hypothetical protein
VASVVSVVVPSLISLVTMGSSYAGANDEAVTSQATHQYQAFLVRILGQVAVLGAIEALAFWLPVLGLGLLALHGRRLSRWAWWLSLLGFGLVTSTTWVAFVAWRHPGLFMALLASSRVLTLLARGGLGLLVVVAGLAAVGLVRGLVRGTRRERAVLGGLLVAAVAVIVVPGQIKVPRRVYKAKSLPAIEAKLAKEGPNVLILAVDSLRPDKIDATNSPTLHKLVSESVYYPNCLVTVPRTGPSWVAAMTSLSPMINGVETMFPTSRQGQLKTMSLPAHLAEQGYRTAAFSEYAGEFFGRVQMGFQVVAAPRVELREITGQMLLLREPTALALAGALYTQRNTREALGEPLTTLLRGMSNFAHPAVLADDLVAMLLADKPSKRPFFSLLFYSQPHFPYTSSAPFYQRYRVPGASFELSFGRDVASERPIETAADHQQVEGLYRAALAETDSAIETLLQRLDKLHALDDTIVVLMADHGEGLYECSSCVGHGDNLQGMVSLRVPLAFRLPKKRFPGAAPRQVDAYVSQLDLYPTLLSLLGLPAIAIHEGVVLLGSDGKPRPVAPNRVHFAETGEWLWTTPAVPADRIDYPPITQLANLEDDRIVIDERFAPEIRAAKHRAVIRFPYKLHYAPGQHGVIYRLFRIDQDPMEQHDLLASEPVVAEELKALLRRQMLRDPRMLAVGDYFVTRPPMPPEESW